MYFFLRRDTTPLESPPWAHVWILVPGVVLASSICWNCSAYDLPNIVLAISIAAVKIDVSPIVCVFLQSCKILTMMLVMLKKH